MRKFLLTILFFSIASSVWAFDYYESNILGMKLGLELKTPPEGAEFILRIEKGPEKEIQSLFRGVELYFTRTFEKIDGMDLERTEKENITETVIRKRGVILSEEKNEEGKPSELVEYNYKKGRLKSSRYSTDGELVYTEIYTYTAESRMLDVVRVYESGSGGCLSSFMFSNGKIRTYWSEQDGEQSFLKFDKDGIFFSEILSAEGWSEIREYGRDEHGRRFELIENENGEKVYLLYNKSGSLYSSSSFDLEGKKTEEMIYLWEQNRLRNLTVKRDLSTEKFSYEYNSEDMLTKETYSKNGIIMQETTYYGEEERVETLYRYGSPILRITYRDGERVQTEQLQER